MSSGSPFDAMSAAMRAAGERLAEQARAAGRLRDDDWAQAAAADAEPEPVPRGDRRIGAARQEGYRDGYEAGLAMGRAMPAPRPSAPSGPPLDEELLRELVKLCHPDRHPAERQEAATAATAELLRRLGR